MDTNTTIAELRADLARERVRADRAYREARTDEKTGLGNVRRWREAVDALQAAAVPFAVVLFDLANLKAANAALGHERADVVLCQITDSIRADGDVACRLGGDEFAVLLPDTTADEARIVRDRIESRAGAHAIAPNVATFLVGDVATWEPGADLAERMTSADFALEARKAERKRALGMPATREATLAAIAA